MIGPRQLIHAQALVLSALLLLPACSTRRPIVSDPPDVRTEAQVRGQARIKAQSGETTAAQPAPPAPVGKGADATVAETKVAEMTAEVPKAVESKAEAKVAETKTVALKGTEAKTVDTIVAEIKAGAPNAEAKTDAATATPKGETQAVATPSVQPDPTQTVATAQANDSAANPHGLVVQIASFSTEKNAQGALSWLKEKGYTETRLVRVEQGQTVYQRVQAGPFQDLAATRKALEELKADWPQAFIPAD